MEDKDFSILFYPKYLGKCRVCDGPNCQIQRKLRKYDTSLGYTLFFCEQHFVDPYNEINADSSKVVHTSSKPVYKDSHYKIIAPDNKVLCGYIGCNEYLDLQLFSNNYYCREHMQIFVNYHVKCTVDKDSFYENLILKLEEFTCRKILSIENLKYIYQLENQLMVDKKLYSQLAVNLIHKEYLINNHKLFENFKVNKVVLRNRPNEATSSNEGS